MDITTVRRFMADVRKATLAASLRRDNGKIESEVIKSLKAAMAVQPELYTELLMAFGGVKVDPKTKKDTGSAEAMWLKKTFGEKKAKAPKATGVEAELVKVAEFSDDALKTFAKKIMDMLHARNIEL